MPKTLKAFEFQNNNLRYIATVKYSSTDPDKITDFELIETSEVPIITNFSPSGLRELQSIINTLMPPKEVIPSQFRAEALGIIERAEGFLKCIKFTTKDRVEQSKELLEAIDKFWDTEI